MEQDLTLNIDENKLNNLKLSVCKSFDDKYAN